MTATNGTATSYAEAKAALAAAAVSTPAPAPAWVARAQEARATAVEQAQAEVDAEAASMAQAEAETPEGTTTVALRGETIRVLPENMWRSRSLAALQTGDFEAWAETSLAGDDYADVWQQVDGGKGPTIGDVTAMFEALGKFRGANRGERRASRRS